MLLLEGDFLAPSLGGIFRIDESTSPAPEMSLPWLSPYRVAEIMRGFQVAALVKQDDETIPAFNSWWFTMVIGHLTDGDYDHLIISRRARWLCGRLSGRRRRRRRSGGTTARSFRRAAEQLPPGRAIGVTLMDGDS